MALAMLPESATLTESRRLNQGASPWEEHNAGASSGRSKHSMTDREGAASCTKHWAKAYAQAVAEKEV